MNTNTFLQALAEMPFLQEEQRERLTVLSEQMTPEERDSVLTSVSKSHAEVQKATQERDSALQQATNTVEKTKKNTLRSKRRKNEAEEEKLTKAELDHIEESLSSDL